MTEGPFWSISLNENGVVTPLMTKLDEPFSVLDGAFKSSVGKLIPIRDLLSFKTT